MAQQDEITRAIIKALALTMADVQALKTLWAVHQPNGYQQMTDALSVAMQEYQPFLDRIAATDDESLLAWLKATKGPVH